MRRYTISQNVQVEIDAMSTDYIFDKRRNIGALRTNIYENVSHIDFRHGLIGCEAMNLEYFEDLKNRILNLESMVSNLVGSLFQTPVASPHPSENGDTTANESPFSTIAPADPADAPAPYPTEGNPGS